jgi:hypothetical protein
MYLSPLETAMLLKSVSALSSEIFFKIDVIDGKVVLVFSIIDSLTYLLALIKILAAKKFLLKLN